MEEKNIVCADQIIQGIKTCIMELFNINEDELNRRMKEAEHKLRDTYNKYDNDKDFYIGESEKYLFSLISWNSSKTMCQPFFNSCIKQCKIRKVKSFLDFGGGIGTLCILAKLNGIEKVYYVDYLNGLGKYAKYLFNKFNIDVGMIDPDNLSKFKEKVDAVAAYDVIEHLENPVKVLNEIFRNLDPKFFYATVCWSEEEGAFPMHYNYKMVFPTFLSSFGFVQAIPSEFVRVMRWT